MLAVLTGCVIGHTEIEESKVKYLLRTVLSRYGDTPSTWDTYRNNTFQLIVPCKEALIAAILIKTTLKKIKYVDVCIGIGLGDISYESERIGECQGSAFMRSGHCFDSLVKRTLGVFTSGEKFNLVTNLMLDLLLLKVDTWDEETCAVISTVLENPTIEFKRLTRLLKKSENKVRNLLKLSGYKQVVALNKFYMTEIPLLQP